MSPKSKAFHMEVSFIHTPILVHLHVNKTNFHMKGFAPGLALKQRRKVTRKSPIKLALLLLLQFHTQDCCQHVSGLTYNHKIEYASLANQ